jgi:hypothetical protein
MHINILLIHHSHFIVWQYYENAFTRGSSFEHIREGVAIFIVSEVIDPKGEFYYNIEN